MKELIRNVSIGIKKQMYKRKIKMVKETLKQFLLQEKNKTQISILKRTKNTEIAKHLNGTIPTMGQFDTLIVRRDKGQTFELIDEESGECIIQVFYGLMQGIHADNMLVISGTFPMKYHGGKRASASGHSQTPQPTFTIGYTQGYGIERVPGFIQKPKFKQGLKEGPLKNGDWEEICNVGRKAFKRIGKLKPNFYEETLEASKHLEEREILIPETPYASCTLNVGFCVNYHVDKRFEFSSENDNSRDSSIPSMALVLWEKKKRHLSEKEGLLVLPEYGIALELTHGDVYTLRAKQTLHGVTPTSGRTSIVFYQHKRV